MLRSATDALPVLLAAAILSAGGVEAQDRSVELNAEDLAFAEGNLRASLAAPDEEAFIQILLAANIVRDAAIDTAFVYDILVRFDPKRYRNMHAGIYSLSFEDQFILWGKRIATYSRSTDWESGRFHLHDISTGEQAWINAVDTRRLFPAPKKDIPPATPNRPDTLDKWLVEIHSAPAATSLRKMGRWIRSMRYGPRDAPPTGG